MDPRSGHLAGTAPLPGDSDPHPTQHTVSLTLVKAPCSVSLCILAERQFRVITGVSPSVLTEESAVLYIPRTPQPFPLLPCSLCQSGHPLRPVSPLTAEPPGASPRFSPRSLPPPQRQTEAQSLDPQSSKLSVSFLSIGLVEMTAGGD